MNYLLKDKVATKMPSKIVKIIRNKNFDNNLVYLIVEDEEGNRKLATIEFYSYTYREYDIPDTKNDTTYIILE